MHLNTRHLADSESTCIPIEGVLDFRPWRPPVLILRKFPKQNREGYVKHADSQGDCKFLDVEGRRCIIILCAKSHNKGYRGQI